MCEIDKLKFKFDFELNSYSGCVESERRVLHSGGVLKWVLIFPLVYVMGILLL